MKRLTILAAMSLLCASTTEAQYPLPRPGVYMPVPPAPYDRPLPPVTRDPYWRPVPPGVDLQREFHDYRGGPQRLCRNRAGYLIPC